MKLLSTLFSKTKKQLDERVAREEYFKRARNDAKTIKDRLRVELRNAVYLKIYALPDPKFKVGEEVRVDCNRENFHFGWDNLGEPLTPGQDELAIVRKIYPDYSRLEELLVEDHSTSSFLRLWTGEASWIARRAWDPNLKRPLFPPELCVADLDTPEFSQAVKAFTDKISINWSYELNFDRLAIRGIRWGINEKYIAKPLPVEVWE